MSDLGRIEDGGVMEVFYCAATGRWRLLLIVLFFLMRAWGLVCGMSSVILLLYGSALVSVSWEPFYRGHWLFLFHCIIN